MPSREEGYRTRKERTERYSRTVFARFFRVRDQMRVNIFQNEVELDTCNAVCDGGTGKFCGLPADRRRREEHEFVLGVDEGCRFLVDVF